jgi:hypothetical protein
MISKLFNITEEQLTWLKQKAIVNQSTSSAVMRRVLREAMEREGYNPLFVSTETVIHNAPATPES